MRKNSIVSTLQASASKAHPMVGVQESSGPIIKDGNHADGKRVATTMDRADGKALAVAVIAKCQDQQDTWQAFAHRAIALSNEGRAEFVGAIDAWLKDLRKGHTLLGMDKKQAGQRIASATTGASEMRTIANAWNAGASVDGLIEFDWTTTGKPCNAGGSPIKRAFADIRYSVILAYARTFSDAKAGRPADSFLVKLGKFLEKGKPGDDAPESDKVEYLSLVAYYNTRTAK